MILQKLYKLFICKQCSNEGKKVTPYWNKEKDWEYCNCIIGKLVRIYDIWRI